MKKKITNIDTFSALLDRLVCESIKSYFFEKEGKTEQYVHQLEVISEIRERISGCLEDCFKSKGYEYLSEKRTFTADDILVELADLVKNDTHIGEADRNRLAETKKSDPNLSVFIQQEQRLRKANEGRAGNKNKLDSILQSIFGNLRWK